VEKAHGSTPGPTGTLSENRSGGVALRRDQQERLESNHCENQTMGRKVRPPCQEVTLKTTGATQSVLNRNLQGEDLGA
jgi:hypothetical protein